MLKFFARIIANYLALGIRPHPLHLIAGDAVESLFPLLYAYGWKRFPLTHQSETVRPLATVDCALTQVIWWQGIMRSSL